MTASLLLSNVAAYALQVALLVGAGALSARLLRLRACVAILVYWQILLAACLILPVCQPWKTREWTPAIAVADRSPGLTNTALPAGRGALPARQPEQAPVREAVLLIIAAGVVLRGSWLLAGFWNLRGLSRESVALPPVLEGVLERVQRNLGVSAEFRASNRTVAPIAFGLRRPTVLLPASICSMAPETQNSIVCHELIHVRRRDWIWCVWEEIVRTLLWFHPAIWWLIGRIHLTREQVVDQAVIAVTESRETYIEALLEAARARMQTHLIPAALFLRKGLLKKRVKEILQEVSMSERRLILCLAGCAFGVILAAGTGAWMFPLEARGRAQTLSTDPIQVLQGGDNLTRRTPIVYPARAIERRVEGDVLLEASLDENGQVSDARVVSGPVELRNACLRSVLDWRYSAPAPGLVQVLIRFQLPKDGSASEVVLPGIPEEKVALYWTNATTAGSPENQSEMTQAQRLERQMRELKTAMADPNTTPDARAALEQQLVESKNQLDKIQSERSGNERRMLVIADSLTTETIKKQIAELRTRLADPNLSQSDQQAVQKQLQEREQQLMQLANDPNAGAKWIQVHAIVDGPVNGKLAAIRAERVPQATRDTLFPRLGVKVGDTVTEQIAQYVRQAVASFDPQLRALFHSDENGNVTLVIVGR